MAAKAMDTEHYAVDTGFRPFVHPVNFVREIEEGVDNSLMLSIDRPGLVWSGDGGSVGLGRVYLNAEMCDHARDGELESAATAYIRFSKTGVPYAFLKPGFQEQAKNIVFDFLVSELRGYDCKYKGTEILLFLVLNDQRKHLYYHFENIDLSRRELVLPFFDSDFLEFVISVPIKQTL